MAARRLSSTPLLLLGWFIISLSIVAGDDGCAPVRDADREYYLPQPAANTLTYCQLYSRKSCCTPAYTTLVKEKQDKIHLNLVNGVLGNLPTNCSKLFDDLACLYCSPEQATFIISGNGPLDEVLICNSFCDKLYEACATAIVSETGQSVSTTFPSGKEFCMSRPWYIPFWPRVIGHDTTCFDPLFPECSSIHYEGKYTACINNRRDYIYSWKKDKDGNPLCSGGVSLPFNKFDLPCDISCSAGYYLPGGETLCSKCPAGTFSIGGGERFTFFNESQPWISLPDGSLTFGSYCQNRKTGESGVCNPWQRHGQYISSGSNKDKHDIESILELDVVLVEDGKITFSAQVDSEAGYDGLRFEAANKVYNIPSGGEFKEYSYNLTKGAHNLRWVYYKDFLWSLGEDMALIQMIQIDGMRFADGVCSPCAPGTYNSLEGQSSCKLCGLNFSPANPPTTCAPCPAEEYSLPGDVGCKLREPCTGQDYMKVYSDCAAPGLRNLTYEWVIPNICIDTNNVLPQNQYNIPCAPCSPGEYRAGNYKCRYCNEGLTSTGGQNPTCTPCPAGTAAIKAQIHDTFEGPWPIGWKTSCDRCDTGGFRRLQDSLDSGNGKDLFFSYLTINNIFYTTGSFSIVWSMDCPAYDCSLAFWQNDKLLVNHFSTGDTQSRMNYTLSITPGNHSIFIDFSRWASLQAHNHTNTRVIIHYIQFTGTEIGGASECVPCRAGTTSTGSKAVCNECPPGTSPNLERSYCPSCPVNTISDRPGLEACLPCGAGTSTKGRTGQTECDNNNCVFMSEVQPGWPVTYNLSALSRSDTMWGPVFDPINMHSYWVNICAKDKANSTCKNPDDTTMETFACQITSRGGSKDLGRLMSFTALPIQTLDDERVIITYTHGTMCEQDTREIPTNNPIRRTHEDIRATRLLYSDVSARVDIITDIEKRDRPLRSTNITLICDPTAGVGYPQAPPEGIEDLRELCQYDFVWYSLHACHICTEYDYEFYYTACQSGTHIKRYRWKFLPKRCFSGITDLPADTVEPCTPSTITCGDGEYVSPMDNNCTKCPPGNYSIGGGEMIDWWETNPQSFLVYCEDDKGNVQPTCEGGWVPDGRVIITKGNIVTNSVLYMERNFVREGSITFDFSLFTEHEEPLTFFIDDRPVSSWNLTTILGHSTFSAHGIRKGTHSFKWKFSPFFVHNKPRMAIIWSVKFVGTQFTEGYCTPCKGYLVQENYGQSSCHVCPLHSTYDLPTRCKACPEGTFALPGDSQCRELPSCTPKDYYEVYTPCVNGKRSTEWKLNVPTLCQGGTAPDPRTDLACECPRGYHQQNDECITCDKGKYWDGTSCQLAETGTAVTRVREWLTSAQGTEVVLNTPAHRAVGDYSWVTGCSGDCGSGGWRSLGQYIDSGAHFDSSVSWVYFNATLETMGEISFDLELLGHSQPGLEVAVEFYIDNNLKNILPTTSGPRSFTFAVGKGHHRFLWIHSLSTQSIRGDVLSKLSKVRVTGVTEGGNIQITCPSGSHGSGGAESCAPCSPGYFAASPKHSKCEACPFSSFAAEEGSSSCLSCGHGTNPNTIIAATTCVTDCKFSVNTTAPSGSPVGGSVTYKFDLSPFLKHPPVVVEANSLSMKFAIQVCDKMIPNQSGTTCKSPTFVCQEQTLLHRSFNAGSLLNFIPFTADDKGGVPGGFTLEYTLGDMEECQGKARKALIHFQCKVGATPFTTFRLDLENHESDAHNCEFHFIAESEYACPLCTEADIKVINGECSGGSREIKYEPLIACLGIPPTKKVSCSNVEVNEFAILVIAGVVVALFVILVALAIYFWNKKRQMTQKYELLVAETQSPLEMQVIDTD